MSQKLRFKKVLIIDDDELDIYISKRVIQSSGFAEVLVTCSNVKEAMDYLTNSHASGTFPDVILLDLNMPGQSGLDFLNLFYAFAQRENISCIIALLMNVVKTEDSLTQQAKSHPLVSYVFEKPLTLKMLLSIRQKK